MTEEEQLVLIDANSSNIELIDDPTPKVVRKALDLNPFNMCRVKVPIEPKLITRMLRKEPKLRKDPKVQHILKEWDRELLLNGSKNPTYEEMMEAVKTEPFSYNLLILNDVKNIPLDVTIAAITKEPFVLMYLDNPSDDLVDLALSIEPNVLLSLVDFPKNVKISEERKLKLLKINKLFIVFFENPSIRLQLVALSGSGGRDVYERCKDHLTFSKEALAFLELTC